LAPSRRVIKLQRSGPPRAGEQARMEGLALPPGPGTRALRPPPPRLAPYLLAGQVREDDSACSHAGWEPSAAGHNQSEVAQSQIP